MELEEQHLILTEEQYKSLVNEDYFIKNLHELKLIPFYEGYKIKKALFFDLIDEKLEKNPEWIKELNNNSEQSLYQFCDIYFSNKLDIDDCPLTLKEFLAEERRLNQVIKYIKEEEVGDKKVYTLIYVRCW